MMTKRHGLPWRGALALGALALLLTSASAAKADPINLVSNGSFETPGTSASFTNFGAGSNLGGWLVVSGSVDIVRSPFAVQDGAQALDLSGFGPGSISQTLATNSGQVYVLSFYAAGNTDGPPLTGKMIQIDVGGNTYFATAPFSLTPQLFTFTFTAASNATLLQFTSLANSPYGAVIDNVSVTTPTPEPATLLLLGTGLAGIGTRVRRRRLMRRG